MIRLHAQEAPKRPRVTGVQCMREVQPRTPVPRCVISGLEICLYETERLGRVEL